MHSVDRRRIPAETVDGCNCNARESKDEEAAKRTLMQKETSLKIISTDDFEMDFLFVRFLRFKGVCDANLQTTPKKETIRSDMIE